MSPTCPVYTLFFADSTGYFYRLKECVGDLAANQTFDRYQRFQGRNNRHTLIGIIAHASFTHDIHFVKGTEFVPMSRDPRLSIQNNVRVIHNCMDDRLYQTFRQVFSIPQFREIDPDGL